MRKIPETVTDPAIISKLNEISKQIEEKMKTVKTLKDERQLQDLKKVSVEIDTLDQEWKSLAGI
jgi:hypothetical protein